MARVHTGEKSFSCDCCGEGFFSAQDLRKHQVREGHLPEGDETTMCRHCGLIFRTLERYSLHQAKCKAKKKGLEYKPRNKDPTADVSVEHIVSEDF